MDREPNLEIWQAALDRHDPAALRDLVRKARPADLAEVIGLLDEAEGLTLLRALPRSAAALVLALLPESTRGDLLDDLSDQILSDLVGHLPLDDAADVLGELPVEQVPEVLDAIPDEQSEKLRRLLAYGEETAGGLMTPVLIQVPFGATVGEAVAEIRLADIDEEFFNIYVTDEVGRLTGLVPIYSLVSRPEETPLGKIMATDLITVRADEDQEAVVNLCRKYDLSAVPVVDDQGRLLGRITADDILDVAVEEADEDLLRMAGTDPAELESTSSLRAARIRATWLLPCIGATLLVAGAVLFFEARSGLSGKLTVLVIAFVPVIAAMGGNTGIQASTRIVRALATGTSPDSRLGRAMAREIPVATYLSLGFGLIAALAGGLIGLAVGGDWMIGVAVGVSMTIAIAAATMLGVALPFVFRRLGVDPAIASGPLVTTSNDVISVAIYLGAATALL